MTWIPFAKIRGDLLNRHFFTTRADQAKVGRSQKVFRKNIPGVKIVRTLHFRRVDEKITAQCILRVNGIGENNPIDISLPSVEATIGGQLLSVQTTKLGNGVFLIKLSEKESQAIQQLGRDDEETIQWRILTSSKAFDIRSKAQYEPSTIDVPVETP